MTTGRPRTGKSAAGTDRPRRLDPPIGRKGRGQGRLLGARELLGGGHVPGDARLAAEVDGDRVPQHVGVVADVLDLQAGPVSRDPEVAGLHVALTRSNSAACAPHTVFQQVDTLQGCTGERSVTR